MPTRRYDDSPRFGALYARTVKATLRRADYEPTGAARRLDPPGPATAQHPLRTSGEAPFSRPAPALPPTSPHVLASPLHLALMSAPSSPYKPMGIVHLSNTITQKQPIP